MVSDTAEPRRGPRPAGVRWRSVRGGLTLLAVTWTLLTLLSVATRLWSLRAAGVVSPDEQRALALVFALFGLGYQIAYGVLAGVLAAAAVRLTRAPEDSGAVGPALVAAVCFGGLMLSVLTLVSATLTPPEERQLSETAISGFWIAALVLRTLALGALVLALTRLARRLQAPLAAAMVGALFGTLALDTVAAALGLLGKRESGGVVLIALQLVFAALLVIVAWRLRKNVRPLAVEEAELEEKAPSEEPNADAAEELDAEPIPKSDPEPDISPAGRVGATILLAIGVGLLPIWDALDPRARLELDGQSPMLSMGVGLSGVFLAWILYGTLGSHAYRARLVVAAAALVGIGYGAMTLHVNAIERSRLVDRFPVCESGESPRGHGLLRPMLSPVDGPRLPSGVPCTAAAERRLEHLEDHPTGSFQDGIVQITKRFPGDRPRALWGSAACLLALLLSGVLVWRSAVEPQVPE